MRRSVIICAIASAMTAVTAHADAPLRVVIVTDTASAAVVERIEGQLADLPVELVRAEAETAHATDLERAHAVAAAHAADAVVWFGRAGNAWIVSVADPRGGRILVREVGADGALSASAALEAAAVVVRTAVRGLAAGGEIGVAANPATPPPAVDGPSPSAPPASPSRVAPLRPFAALGWIGALDGDATTGHHGLAARLGVSRRRWRAALTVAYLPPTRRASALAAIELDREEVAATAAYALHDARRWRVDAALAIGAVRFGRVTTAAAAPLRPTDDHASWSLVVAPGLEVARALGGGAWLELGAGIAVLASRPTFGVDGGTGFVAVAPLGRVHPTLSLRVSVGAL